MVKLTYAHQRATDEQGHGAKRRQRKQGDRERRQVSTLEYADKLDDGDDDCVWTLLDPLRQKVCQHCPRRAGHGVQPKLK